MKNLLFYKVAGLTFCIELHEGIALDAMLGAYEPFSTEATEEPLFLLKVVNSTQQDARGEADWQLLLDSNFEGMITEIFTDATETYHYTLHFESQPDMWTCVDFTRDLRQM